MAGVINKFLTLPFEKAWPWFFIAGLGLAVLVVLHVIRELLDSVREYLSD